MHWGIVERFRNVSTVQWLTVLTVLQVCVCPHAQCLHRCMDNSECPDKNRLPGDVSPAGAHCSGSRIGQKSHSSSSYHALHSLFPKALATSSLNLICLWLRLGCSETRRDALVFLFSIESTAKLSFWWRWTLLAAAQTGWVCWVNDDGAASWYSRVVAMWRCRAPSPWSTVHNSKHDPARVLREYPRKVCVTHTSWNTGSQAGLKSSF